MSVIIEPGCKILVFIHFKVMASAVNRFRVRIPHTNSRNTHKFLFLFPVLLVTSSRTLASQDITIGTLIMKLSKRGFLHNVVVLVVVLAPSVNPTRNDPQRRFLARRSVSAFRMVATLFQHFKAVFR